MARNGSGEGLDDVVDKIFAKGAATTPPIPRPDGGFDVLTPEGYRVHTIHPLEKPLTRIRQTVTMHDVDSFNAYITQYKSENTRLFAVAGHLAADRKAIITAIFDYHAPDKPDYSAHVANYRPRYSEQWERWTKVGTMEQAAFAEFIEENRADIQRPEAAQLLDIVTRFKATKKTEFDSVVYQPNGDVTVGWSEKTEHHAKPGIQVPQQLEVGIPVFFKGDRYSVTILMRYRLQEGKLLFVLKADRPDVIEQHAFDEIISNVHGATDVQIYLGTPS